MMRWASGLATVSLCWKLVTMVLLGLAGAIGWRWLSLRRQR